MKLDLFEEAEVKPKHDPGGKVCALNWPAT